MITQLPGGQAISSVGGNFQDLNASSNSFRNFQGTPGQKQSFKRIIERLNVAAGRGSEVIATVIDTKIRSIHGFIDKIPGPVVALAGVLMALTLGVLDKVIGHGINLSFFYLLPVLLVSWKFSARILSVLMASFCALTWFAAGALAGPGQSHSVINGIMCLGILAAVAYSFSTLKNVLQRERGFARIDYLTGIPNARDFYEKAEIEFSRSARYGRPLSIVVLDIDNFKFANDNYGHSSGDRLLHTVARTIQKTLRKTDTIARIGGDEFSILLPETESGAAMVAVNKVRDHLLRAVQKNGWPVTFSMGLITRMRTQCTLDNLMEMADDLMYRAKNDGKNKVLTGNC